MSQSELQYILKGSEEKEQEEWERIRTICFYTVVSGVGSKRIKKPTDLFKFPWDKKEIGKKMTQEEIKKLGQDIKAIQDGKKEH